MEQKTSTKPNSENVWYETNERFVIIEKFEIGHSFFYDNQLGMGSYFRNEEGLLHRNNGNPSYLTNDIVMWHKNGKLHRDLDRPSKIMKRYKTRTMENESLTLQERLNVIMGIFSPGTPEKEYHKNGLLHRENDLPAVIFSDPKKHLHWFYKGKLHRDNNKPSVINGNFLHYHKNGILYKSEIKYDNKIINWILDNSFKLVFIVFLILFFIAIFLI